MPRSYEGMLAVVENGLPGSASLPLVPLIKAPRPTRPLRYHSQTLQVLLERSCQKDWMKNCGAKLRQPS
jgi:hypothetical protein